jgi:uncharacterized protein with ATP-grasp and redox domains
MYDDCSECILRMLSRTVTELLSGEAANRFLDEVRSQPGFLGGAVGPKCPVYIGRAWTRLVEESGVQDPLADAKRGQNEAALAMLPAARKLVRDAADPFRQAAELAIVSNSIDAMVGSGRPSKELPDAWAAAHIAGRSAADLERRVIAARSVMYIGDNCGEAVFDRLLLEALRERGVKCITYLTRHLPVLNDVTLAEAKTIGLGEHAELLSNGIEAMLPGTDWNLLPASVQEKISGVDLVIVKGGGNYKLLAGEPQLAGRVFFLFHGKCAPVCREHGVPTGTPIIWSE